MEKHSGQWKGKGYECFLFINRIHLYHCYALSGNKEERRLWGVCACDACDILSSWLVDQEKMAGVAERDRCGAYSDCQKKSYRFLVGEAVWVFLLLLEFLFIDIFPAFFLGTAAGNMSSAYVDAGIIAFAAWSFWQNWQ